MYLISAYDYFLVDTNLNAWDKLSSESNSFFIFLSNNKLLGFNIKEETSLSSPGLTNAIYGVTFSFKLYSGNCFLKNLL